MSDARLESIGQKSMWFLVPSRSRPGEHHSVEVRMDSLESKCVCEHAVFVNREGGERVKTDEKNRVVTGEDGRPIKYVVGPPGKCWHRRVAEQEAKRIIPWKKPTGHPRVAFKTEDV